MNWIGGKCTFRWRLSHWTVSSKMEHSVLLILWIFKLCKLSVATFVHILYVYISYAVYENFLRQLELFFYYLTKRTFIYRYIMSFTYCVGWQENWPRHHKYILLSVISRDCENLTLEQLETLVSSLTVPS